VPTPLNPVMNHSREQFVTLELLRNFNRKFVIIHRERNTENAGPPSHDRPDSRDVMAPAVVIDVPFDPYVLVLLFE